MLMNGESHESIFEIIPPEREDEARENIRRVVAVVVKILERIHADPTTLEQYKSLTKSEGDPRIESYQSVPTSVANGNSTRQ